MKPGEDGPEGDGGDGEGGPLNLSFWKLVIWSLGVCLFGVVFAVPLRKEVIVREKLRFPSGTASALMLKVLHGSEGKEKVVAPENAHGGVFSGETESSSQSQENSGLLKNVDTEDQASQEQDWRSKMRLLVGAFAVSGVYVSFYHKNDWIKILTISDLVFLLRPSSSRHSIIWYGHGTQLAMDSESVTRIHWSRNNHGAINVHAHALRCRAGMGNLITTGQEPRLGPWPSGKLGGWQ
jgi:hypothetical protein